MLCLQARATRLPFSRATSPTVSDS